MTSHLSSRFSSLVDVYNIQINKIGILSFVLLFFFTIHILNAAFRAGLSPSKVRGTIKIALMGLALLLLGGTLEDVPFYGPLVSGAQSLIVLVCVANLVTYLAVDMYAYFKMNRHVPTILRDLLSLLVYLVFAMAALRVVFRIDVSSILTTTTVLTAAVAFAMQTTIANVISGFHIQSDANLKTLDNQQVMVPNNFVMQNIVHSLGSGEEGELTAVSLRVSLGYDLPPEKTIGDAVNVASRFSGLAKAGQILVTSETRSLLGPEFPVREHPPASVKGKTEPLAVFEILTR